MPTAEVHKEPAAKNAGRRCVRSPRTSAQKPIRLAFRAKKRTPPESETLAGFVDWTDQPYSDPRLQPSGLPEPAGRFHRGATRGELDSMVSGSVEDMSR